jgi:hypothetical protein
MVGPNFRPPDAPAATRYTETDLPGETASAPGSAGSTQRFAPGQDLPSQWWTLFHSDPLDRLVRQAIADSPNLTAAEAALRVSRENLSAQTGALLYPQVDGTLGASREKASGASLGQPGAGTTILSSQPSVNVLSRRRRRNRASEALQSLVDYQVPARRRPPRADIERRHFLPSGKHRCAHRSIRRADHRRPEQIARLGAPVQLGRLAASIGSAMPQARWRRCCRRLSASSRRRATSSPHSPAGFATAAFRPSIGLDLAAGLAARCRRRWRGNVLRRAAEALLHQASAQIGLPRRTSIRNQPDRQLGAQATELHPLPVRR